MTAVVKIPLPAQPGIYADLDKTDMDYEHAYQPLDKITQKLVRHLQDPNSLSSETKAASKDFRKSQREPAGAYENFNKHNGSMQDPISHSSKSTATNDRNREYLIPLPAQPGIYADLDKTDMDSEHAYQPPDKGSQKTTRQDSKSLSSKTMQATGNNHSNEPNGPMQDHIHGCLKRSFN